MILTWFTQPAGSYASYYQYETETRKFSRIRLELGRNGTGETFVSSQQERVVGFSADRYSTKSADWKVVDGALYYGETRLPSEPITGARTYDTSNASKFIHRGRPVTENPSLPPDIKGKHLALLANEAMKTGVKITLTENGQVAPEVLSAAIKGQVCRIIGKPDFAAITDDDIINKLTSQVKEIGEAAVSEAGSDLEETMNAVLEDNQLIVEQIEDGSLTPTAEFEQAFGSLQSALSKVQNRDTMRQVLDDIGQARSAVETAVKNIDAAKYEAMAERLDRVSRSLDQAQEQATEWQAVETEYRPLFEASTVEEYGQELGIETEAFG